MSARISSDRCKLVECWFDVRLRLQVAEVAVVLRTAAEALSSAVAQRGRRRTSADRTYQVKRLRYGVFWAVINTGGCFEL